MKRSLLLASFLAMLSWSAPTALAASDYLLELDGIKGESPDSVHPGTIELESWSWGASNPSVVGGGGTGAGKANFQDLHFTCSLDKASPQLFLACASGTHIPSAKLFVRKAGGQQDYYIITLTDILVTSFNQAPGSSADTTPAQSFSFNYAKIEWSYRAADGSAVNGGWDIIANKKI